MESSSGNLSEEACNTKAACQCSSNDTDSLSSLKSKAGNDKYHTCSETSNLLSACSVSVNSSPLEGLDEVEEGCNCSNKPKKLLTKESLQGTGPFSDKSEPSSITSQRDVYVGASSLKGDISECSMDQAESSYMRSGTVTVEGHKHDVLDSAESAKSKSGGDLASKSVKCSNQNEDFVSIVVPNVYEPPVRSHPVGCHDGSDILEDVKVCDICGDAGREDLLAICSKCADGAEHIYCMRIKLDKVPDGNWTCEECMPLEEIEKQKQSKNEPVIGSLKRSNEICRNAGTSSTANIRSCLDMDIEGSNVKKSRRDNVSSVPQFSAKRKAGELDSALVKKRRSLQTSVESPRVSSNDRSFGIRANARSPTTSGHNSPKFLSRLPMSRGTLYKSKSFNISDSKCEVQSRAESQKKTSCRETSIIDKKMDGAVRKISKSLSFNNVSSGRPNIGEPKVKMLSASLSRVENLKRLKGAKGSSSIQNKYISKPDKPRVSSPTTSSCISPSKNGRRVTCNGRPTEALSSANKNLNPKLSRHVAREDYKCPDDPSVTGGVKRLLRSCFSDVARNPSSPIISDSSHELRPKGTPRSNSFPTNSRHCGSTGAIAQVILSQSGESSDQHGKAHEGSNFGCTGEQIKAGNLRGHKYKDTVNAAESCRIISPRTSVRGGGKGEDVDQSNPMDLGLNTFLQPDVSKNFAIPTPDFIWRGGFEMMRWERLPRFIRGIQAHLSTRGTPNVLEVVKKFPCNILLEEVSRSSTWPTQFQQINPSENSVALYFFAEDFESYTREYKGMVECMICCDLALKGNIDGLELLIFPSNLLPQTSQRWNNLYFLWGVFRGVKVDDTQCLPSSENETSIPNLNNAIPDRDYSIPGKSGFQNIHSSEPSSECLSASKLYHNVQHLSNSISHRDLPCVSFGRNDENCKPELPYPEQNRFGLQTNFDSKNRDDIDSFSNIPTRKEQLRRDLQDANNFLKEQVLVERKHEDTQCLDLNLSLKTGSKSAKELHGIVEKKNNEDKYPNLLGREINTGGGDDEFSASLNLSLRLSLL